VSSSTESYTIRGIVRYSNGTTAKNIKVQAIDSDQELFQDHNDDIIAIVPINDANGKFEITFNSKDFKDDWLEGNPDISLIIRNASDGSILYKTEIRKGLKRDSPDLNFDIILDSDISYTSALDPYVGNIGRVVAAFDQIEVEFAISDFSRNSELLISSINGWVLYNDQNRWQEICYDGPQVPRYPWLEKHEHTLSWEAKGTSGRGRAGLFRQT
jgi:hypothetical protein